MPVSWNFRSKFHLRDYRISSALDLETNMKIINRLTDRFSKVTSLPEGLYHLQAAPQDQTPYRVHLRLRKDGTGILIINAATLLHLNATAAEYVYLFIIGTDP